MSGEEWSFWGILMALLIQNEFYIKISRAAWCAWSMTVISTAIRVANSQSLSALHQTLS